MADPSGEKLRPTLPPNAITVQNAIPAVSEYAAHGRLEVKAALLPDSLHERVGWLDLIVLPAGAVDDEERVRNSRDELD
jgi:hypothetical protein